MSRELIESLARAAGVPAQDIEGLQEHHPGALAKFAHLVAEECAEIAENTLESDCDENDKYATSAAGAIRAKFPAPEVAG